MRGETAAPHCSLVVYKPFGHASRASREPLNAPLHECSNEESIYRMTTSSCKEAGAYILPWPG